MTYAFLNSFDFGTPANSTTNTGTVTYVGGEHVYIKTTRQPTASETLSDGTNTYTLVGGIVPTAGGDTQNIYECASAAAGTFTLVQTANVATQYKGVQGLTYTGLAGSSNALGNYQNGPGTAADAATSGSFTPSGQPALVLAWIYDYSSFAATINPGSGFGAIRSTFPTESNANGSSSAAADRRITATSSLAATFTIPTTGAADQTTTFAIFCLEATTAVVVDDDQVITS